MTYLSEQYDYFFLDIDINTAATFTDDQSNAWLDVSHYHEVEAILFRTVGTSKCAAKLMGSSVAAGTSPVEITSSTSTNATGLLNAAAPSSQFTGNVGRIVLRATADEIAAAGENLRYIAVEVFNATATDEFGLMIRGKRRYPRAIPAAFNTGNA